ncbi:MAG: DnaA regulatory inactivator Hda [Woeseiaceae bacterium]|nr:DnaA regulatory inactivator Hda [Woeseiaceae bacterium]
MSQLALPLQLDDHAVFESFLPAGNETLVALLEETATSSAGSGCWIWGANAVGKSHLLQAVAARAGDRSAYVPLKMLAGEGPDVIEGLDQRTLVCLDDIDSVSDDDDWERALFTLYNSLLAEQGQLIVSAGMAPRECPIRLPDLASRMSQLPTFRIAELSDSDREAALKLRSSHRGLELPDETARYLMSRSRRDMASLYRLLDTLDQEALRAKRRLTIPFVRDVMNELSSPSTR